MKPYIDDAIARYDDDPSGALLVVAVRHGFWGRSKWKTKARRILNRAKAEQRRGFA
jgi:hypothetical protein